MKKIIITLICLIFLTACYKEDSKEYKMYSEYIDSLEKYEGESSLDIPFNINIELEKIMEDEILYIVTIDDFKEEIYDIEALVIHDYKTNNVFPSTGIYESKLDYKSKGIILGGYIEYSGELSGFKTTFKLKIKYKDKENKEQIKYYIRQY